MKALLLCAGLGTRLRPYTNELPKPCIPFLGIPLAWYSFYLLKQAGCKDVVMNLHHLPNQVKAMAMNPALKEFNVSFSLEAEKPLGSGGALYHAKNQLTSSHFFAINGDEVMVPSRPDILSRLREHNQKTGALATLLVTDHPELMKTLKPVWINDAGAIRGFGQKPDSTESLRPVHYTGYKIFSNQILQLVPPGETHIFLDTLVPAMQKGLLANTLYDSCAWWETGNFDSFLQATGEAIRMVHEAPEKNHFADVHTAFGKNFDFKTTGTGHMVARSAKAKGADLRGTVFIGVGAELPDGLRVEDSIINDGIQVTRPLLRQMVF